MDPQYLDRLNPKYLIWVAAAVLVAVTIPWTIYQDFRIDVPNKQMAVLIRKTGEDLEPGVSSRHRPSRRACRKRC